MLLKKYVKNRRKIKILLFFAVLGLIAITLVAIFNSTPPTATQHLVANGHLHNSLASGVYIRDAYGSVSKLEQGPAPYEVLKSPKENGIVVPEKYDERKIKARIIQDKIAMLKQRGGIGGRQQQPQQHDGSSGEEHTVAEIVTKSIHIFYSAPVPWYKTKKPQTRLPAREVLVDEMYNNETVLLTTQKPLRALNIAFYPALGLYKPSKSLLEKHFHNIKNCGIGVLILNYKGGEEEQESFRQILDLAPNYNLSVTFEISVAGNQSVEFMRQQLLGVRKYSRAKGFYQVYSLSRNHSMPFIYISNAYKLDDSIAAQAFCGTEGLRRVLNAYFIGHIRLKNHADSMRRLCFEGFYSKLPSNGATFASTWKNWSYLKSFAVTYNMLFAPTVGPGFAERNKFPRHGDIQRHRSNGRYYGVAWRTAILNHVGFINVASYNNWPDGSQIEEVIPKAGFLDYSPGPKTKYLDLTAHWVNNFLKSRHETTGPANCYELLNNTIC